MALAPIFLTMRPAVGDQPRPTPCSHATAATGDAPDGEELSMVTTTTDANTWEGTSVDVAAIEKALGELWKRTGHQELADGRQLPVRTNVLNLVVHVPHDAGAECASDAVA